ncbi:MAG: hypothetical protein CR982_05925 [Candidatus Cloacimonadota bacterium]|nr:MAG: hypothetical protein CR982_05925 [Candidatus Cloacimonadota bacterium]PIE78058.1 MAG: hypothetical protein CSA15_09485 [Candidatus Delongbacteria bacterium]
MKRYKILIIDDDLLVGEYLISALKKSEDCFDTFFYSNPLRLLDEPKEFDLIIVDIAMPEIDGITLIKSAREMDIYKNTPVIFYSSERGSDHKLRVFDDDIMALAYVNKGNGSIESLLNEIKSIFWKNIAQENSKDIHLIRETGKALGHHTAQFLQVIRSYAELIELKCQNSDDEILKKLGSHSRVIIKNSEKLDNLVTELQNIRSLKFEDIGAGDRIIDVGTKED